MSALEIIEELPRLTPAELAAVERRIDELISGTAMSAGRLRIERTAGRVVLAGTRVVRQAEVDAILDEFP